MSSRTVQDIEAEITAIKAANPKWVVDVDVIKLITSLTNEKNQLGKALFF